MHGAGWPSEAPGGGRRANINSYNTITILVIPDSEAGADSLTFTVCCTLGMLKHCSFHSCTDELTCLVGRLCLLCGGGGGPPFIMGGGGGPPFIIGGGGGGAPFIIGGGGGGPPFIMGGGGGGTPFIMGGGGGGGAPLLLSEVSCV